MISLRTRSKRRVADRRRAVRRLFAVRDEPNLVLRFLAASDVAAAGMTCREVMELAHGAVGRTLAGAWPLRSDMFVVPPTLGPRLETLRWVERVGAAASAWRVVRVTDRRSAGVVRAFTSHTLNISASGQAEAALLVHAGRRICLEVVGTSNGWYRWTTLGASAPPRTGTPPSWMDGNQAWDTDWASVVDQAEDLWVPLVEKRNVLPGRWKLSWPDGKLSCRNGNVWLHLTVDGFVSAQNAYGAAGQPEFRARYECIDTGDGGVIARLPTADAGPWTASREPPVAPDFAFPAGALSDSEDD